MSATALQRQGAGAVAEQHAGAAVLPVENAREGLGADHQRGARLAEPQRIVGRRQRKDKPGADRLYVKGGAAVHAEPRLHLGRGRREGVVRGRGGEDDQIEVAGAHPRIGEGAFGGAHREVRGQLALGRHPPLADPGALADPFVGGVETRGKVAIGDNALGQIAADADDLRTQYHRRALTASPAEVRRSLR